MITTHFKGSVVYALLYLFPDVNFDVFKFKHAPKNTVTDFRVYFMYLAKKYNFDYLNPEHWYDFSISKVEV